MPSRLRLRTACIAAAAAFAIKAALATLTLGTNDILSWQSFLQKILSDGGLQLYREVPLFNHPPFMIHLLQLWGRAETRLHLPLAFSLRMTSALADLGTAWLMWKLASQKNLAVRPAALWIVLLSPVSILIAGFHGNTDPLMMFLVAAAVYAAETHRGPWLIGFCLGAAMNIKVVPVLLIPALFFWLDGLRNRVIFLAATGIVFLGGSMPYIAQEPGLVLMRVFAYGGLQGQWGWSLPARLLAQQAGLPVSFAALALGERICLLFAVMALALWMNRAATKPSPFLQCGFVMFVFLAAAPGWGVQYLDWLVLWTLVLGATRAAMFHIVSGVFLFVTYTVWSGGLPWYLADSTKFSSRPWEIILLGELAWAVIVLLAARFYDLIQQNRLPAHKKMTKKAEYLLVSFHQEC